MDTQVKTRRRPRSRLQPNPLRDWLARRPKRGVKLAFANEIGITDAYLSMLLADDPPWPNREIVKRIAAATGGEVDANVLAGVTS